MSKTIILILFLVASIKCTKGQTVNVHNAYDSLPRIQYLYQNLPLLDKIKCAAYLFVHDYTVRDSIGNIYISLFYDSNRTRTTAGLLNATVVAIFDLVYFFAIEPNLEFMNERYKNVFIGCYYKNGQLFYNKVYPIGKYRYPGEPLKHLDGILRILRWPVTWCIKENRFEITYYCIDPEEKRVYFRPLVLIITQLKLISKKCTIWKEFYSDCNNREYAETFILEL